MSYLVLARKWRPQTFSDLVGQDHVARTLGNAIAQNRVAHAFLFTGVRGVGKTTSARILAKALNCQQGPTDKPCLECSACKEIAAGNDVDVLEIDGASHTGVDDVRRIQESLPFRPARDRFKILIVDEVHMLSNNAWNAFLKTLEEPPPHVKFIFATTEVHKVPITILSRCQRFDFKMISARQISERVRYILEQEKIEADDSTVALVAREAAGSMRDALSILDQIIAFSGDKLVGEEVARALGVADRSALSGLAASLVDRKPEEALERFDRMTRDGFDVAHLARDLLRHVRDLVVARSAPSHPELLDIPDGERAEVAALVQKTDADDLVRLFSGVKSAVEELGRTPFAKQTMEVALVRLARRPQVQSIDGLLEKLAHLESRLLGGPDQPPSGGGAPSPGGGPPRGGPPRPPMGGPPVGRAMGPVNLVVNNESRPAAPTTMQAQSTNAPAMEARKVEAPMPSASPNVQFVPQVPPQNQLPQDAFDAATRLGSRVRQVRPNFGALVAHGVFLQCDEQGVKVAYERKSLLGAQAAENAFVRALSESAATEGLGEVLIFVSDAKPAGRTLAMMHAEANRAYNEGRRLEILAHPLIAEAIALFEAQVLGVKIPDSK